MPIAALASATGLSPTALALLPIIVLVAAVIRGYAGFGFSAIVVAAASLFVPTREAVPLVLALEVIASVQMARQIWQHVNWKLVLYILLSGLVFIPIGQYLLRVLPLEPMRIANAVLLLIAVALVAAGRFFTMKNAPSGWLLTGVVSGFMNGLLAMGGMWMMVCLINSGARIAVLRASIIALFFMTDCYAFGIASVNGLVDEQLFWRVACVLPFMYVGILIGARRFHPEHEQTYKKVALGVLAMLAVLLLARTLAVA